jgi:hypothetical protein
MLSYLNFVNLYSSTSGSFGGGTYGVRKTCTGTSKDYRSVGEIGRTIQIVDTNKSVTGINYFRRTVTYIGGYTTTYGFLVGDYPDTTIYKRVTTRISRITTNQCQHNEADIAGGDLNESYAASGLDGATGLGEDGAAVG